MDSISLLLGSHAFWAGLISGLVLTVLLLALMLALLAWYDAHHPLEEVTRGSKLLDAGVRRARPSPDASPVYVWPRRSGAEL